VLNKAPVRIHAETVEIWPISSLIPYARNAKKHPPEQIKQLVASIREFGFTIPVLVDEHRTIIAGHGRVVAAQEAGLEEVPVIVAKGWTDEQRRAYTLADNKLTEGGEWDEELLKIELGDLSEEGFDVGLIGFSAKEIDKMLEAAEKEASPPDDFPEFGEDIETEHQCPKCGYRWSGKTA
jgi:Predicted transcriptional regulators